MPDQQSKMKLFIYLLALVYANNASAHLLADGAKIFVSREIASDESLRKFGKIRPEIEAIDISSSKIKINSFGSYHDHDNGFIYISDNQKEYTISKYPKHGHLKISAAGYNNMATRFDCNKENLIPNENLMIAGYLTRDWSYEAVKIEKIEYTKDNQCSIYPKNIKSPGQMKSGNNYILLNHFAGISDPGEYVYDEQDGIIYLIGNGAGSQYKVSSSINFLTLNGENNLSLNDLKISNYIGIAVTIKNSKNISINGCEIKNIGVSAFVIENSEGIDISSCTIENIGGTAIKIKSGDIQELNSSRINISNNKITRFSTISKTNHPAIEINGVGITVQGNNISQSSGSSIIIKGNDNIVSNNVIHDVVLDAKDAGAIYSGRSWSDRGNTITGNYFYRIGSGDNKSFVSSVYLDDRVGGYFIYNNKFIGGEIGLAIHGGRDNIVQNNYFYGCKHGIWVGPDTANDIEYMREKLRSVPINSKNWMEKYGNLDKFFHDEYLQPGDNFSIANKFFDCDPKKIPPEKNEYLIESGSVFFTKKL